MQSPTSAQNNILMIMLADNIEPETHQRITHFLIVWACCLSCCVKGGNSENEAP